MRGLGEHAQNGLGPTLNRAQRPPIACALGTRPKELANSSFVWRRGVRALCAPKHQATLFALWGFILPCLLVADGGAVLFQRHAGPFIVTLFSASAPLRSGPADLSVLLVSAVDNQPVLDAKVTLILTTEGKQLTTSATHAEATNRLLYAATADLPKPGKWQAAISIDQHGMHAEATGIIDVLPGPPRLLYYWPYFAIVPLMIALFLVHQRLKRREVRGRV